MRWVPGEVLSLPLCLLRDPRAADPVPVHQQRQNPESARPGALRTSWFSGRLPPEESEQEIILYLPVYDAGRR